MTEDRTIIIEHRIEIAAPRDLVFEYFTDPERLARWMAPGSTIGDGDGAAVDVVLPGGTRAEGRVVHAERPSLLVFTWGIDEDDALIPPGASLVEVVLEECPAGTSLTLRHTVPARAAPDEEEAAWKCHVARLAARSAGEHLRDGIIASVGAWHSAWSLDADAVHDALEVACVDDVVYTDDTVHTFGRDALAQHVARCRAQMPGVRLERQGGLLACGATVTCDERMVLPDGTPIGSIRLVAAMAPDGRIREAKAFLGQAVPGVTPGAVVEE